MPFGRTDVVIGAHGAPSPELSYGHDLKCMSFQRVSKVGIFFIFASNRNRKIEDNYGRIWSYVQRSRYHKFEFFLDLQDGHGFMVIGVKNKSRNGNVKLKTIGSDLVVQRSRYHHFEAFFEIYKIGIASAA